LAAILLGSSTTQNPRPRHAGTGNEVAGLLARHFRDGFRFEDAAAVESALVQHHLIEAGQVFGGREEAGAAQRRTLAIGHGGVIEIRDSGFFQLGGLRNPAIAERVAR